MRLRISLAFASLPNKESDSVRIMSARRSPGLDRKRLFAAAALSLITFQAALAGDAPIVRMHGFTFVTPLGWTLIQRPPGRDVALFTVGQGSENAELLFRQYGYGGQSATGDAEEWFSEFSGNASTRYLQSEKIGSVTITYATTRGTFTPDSSLKKIAPRKGYALCGAILEGDSGVAYVKLVGPIEMVSGLTAEFTNMVSAAAKTETVKKRARPK